MSLEYVQGFFSLSVLKFAVVNLVCGGLLGVSTGFVAVHTTFVQISQNCTLYQSPLSCDAVGGGSSTSCRWGYSNVSASYKCLFDDGLTECSSLDHSSSDQCSRLSHCSWSYDDSLCRHVAGYSAVDSGIFCGATVVGGLVGSLAIGHVVNRFGRKRCMIFGGLAASFCSGLVHIADAKVMYSLLVAARFLLGVVVGALCCVGPMYVDEMVPSAYANPVGVLFQGFFTFAMMLAALQGYFLNPTDFTTDVNMPLRFQLLDALPTISSLLVMITGIFMTESTKWTNRSFQDIQTKDQGFLVELSTETIQLLNSKDSMAPPPTWWEMKGVLGVAFMMALAQQLTGCNAIFNYAPNITKSMNFAPLTGNVIVLAWNALTSLVSVPFASKCSMRSMFLVGTLFASVAGFLTGIPLYPGVASEDTRSKFAIAGVSLFLLAFEIGIGSTFFVLAQTLFPENFRAKGSSFTMVCMFLFNISLNVGFPIVVEAVSGGPSGNQNKGMSVTFLFFGCVGAASLCVLVKFLKPHE